MLCTSNYQLVIRSVLRCKCVKRSRKLEDGTLLGGFGVGLGNLELGSSLGAQHLPMDTATFGLGLV